MNTQSTWLSSIGL